MKFKVVIPARWASTRLPGKPLADIGGRPMIAWVWDIAMKSGAEQVVIATDDSRVAEAARSFGAEVCMTAPDHESGTDRIDEVAQTLDWPDSAIVVNLQGDEPLLPPELIAEVVAALDADASAGISTIATAVVSLDEAKDSNTVKVVLDAAGRALYFSRSPIPHHRDRPGDFDGMLRHIGLYAYRVSALGRIASLPPAVLEQAERLEQLRALANGIPIAVAVASTPPPTGVDTPEDLERVRRLLV